MAKLSRLYDDKDFGFFKPIRNKLCKYKPIEVIQFCLDLLRKMDKRPELMARYPPWSLMLLIKWAMIWCSRETTAQTIAEEDFARIFRDIHDLQNVVVPLPSEHPHLYIYMRRLAFLEFPYQQKLSHAQLARAQILFGNLPDGHVLKDKFFQETGLKIEPFIDLGFALISAFDRPETSYVIVDSFESIERSYGRDAIRNFLSTLSASMEELEEFILSYSTKYKNPLAFEFFEDTPFRRYPLIKKNDHYEPFSQNLLFQSLKDFIHDFLKDYDKQWFMQEFGNIFERYVGMGLSFSGVPFATEDDINQRFRDGRKRPDFLVIDNNANIFIEAKAIEMKYLGKVELQPKAVHVGTNKELLDGIEQAYDLASRLSPGQTIGTITVPGTSDNYLLIVTYKELYVGHGTLFYNVFAKRQIDNLASKYDGKYLIQPENMFFISIDEFELLMQSIHEGKTGFLQMLKKAIADDSNPATEKFMFAQHVATHGFPEGMPDYLENEFQRIMRRLQNSFRPAL